MREEDKDGATDIAGREQAVQSTPSQTEDDSPPKPTKL